nr:DMT family transporter [candidate division Zixibacteria bacterium]
GPAGALAAQRRTGYLLALISAVGGGAATATGKWNLVHLSPLAMNALIFSLATVMLSAWVLPGYGPARVFRQTRRAWFWILLFSLSSWFAVLLVWAGVQKMDPSLASFLNRSEVLVAIALGILFLGERLSRIETLGVLLSLAGIALMRLTLRGEYSVGFGLVLLGSIGFGLTEFISKHAVRHVDPLILTYIRNGLLALGYWAVLFAAGGDLAGLAQVWPGVIALALFGPLVSRLFYLQALARLELTKVAVISQSQPVVVMLIALALLHQLPTAREALGGLLLLIGCVIMAAAHRRPWARFGQQADTRAG